jgi:hypothetical protein
MQDMDFFYCKWGSNALQIRQMNYRAPYDCTCGMIGPSVAAPPPVPVSFTRVAT